MSTTRNYPYIRAEGVMRGLTQDQIDEEVALAKRQSAPQDSWCRLPASGGGWRWHKMRDLRKAAAQGNPYAADMVDQLETMVTRWAGRACPEQVLPRNPSESQQAHSGSAS